MARARWIKLSIVLPLIAAVLALPLAATISSKKANAISGSDFNAGRIIDDVTFTNNSSMSVADIQNFLNAKVPTCDTNGTQPSSHWNNGAGRYYTRAEWGALNGNPAPYTCLKDYRENPDTAQNNFSNPGASIAGSISAAQMIYNAAQSYRINPQVLLTTLQKEQGLVTDDWPWFNEYQYAMGYACPDTGGCSASNSGFFKQIDGGAWQFRYYLDHPNAFNYWVGNYYVKYNPNSSCGGSVINIQNAATAALYIYTPYQPNGAALANLNGTGDACSAYGNRNFWRYFSEWFGSTLAPSYGYQVLDQYVYSDQTKTQGTNLYNKLPGDRVYVGVKVKNLSNRTWYNSGANPIDIGTDRPTDRNSPYCDNTWLGCNRPARMLESSVDPGGTATFEFWMQAPDRPGGYSEYFDLVAEGAAWMPSMALHFDGSVMAYNTSYQVLDQYAYTDQTKTVGRDTTKLMPGDRVYVGVKVRNTGNFTWNQSGHMTVRLGTLQPADRTSSYYDSTWVSPTRPANLVEAKVDPGQIGTFEFWMKASRPGVAVEHFAPVAEAVTWLNDQGLNFYMNTNTPQYSWQFLDQYAYTDQTKTVGKGTTNLNPGDRVYVGFKAKNTGNVTWYNNGSNPVNIGMVHPMDRLSNFFDDSWLGQNRPAHMVESSVAPGQIGTFEFWMKAPNKSGTYLEYFDLVAEGAAWMNDPNMNFYMSVR